MLSNHPHTTATIDREILLFPFNEDENSKLSTYSVRNTGASLELRFEEAIEFGRAHEFADTQRQRLAFFSYSEEDIPNWKAIESGITREFSDTQRQRFAFPRASLALFLASKEYSRNWKSTEFGRTHEFSDTQRQRRDFPTYSEEDILNWDVAIENPPPRPSGTIRVKLKYKGRSKPIPVENPWE